MFSLASGRRRILPGSFRLDAVSGHVLFHDLHFCIEVHELGVEDFGELIFISFVEIIQELFDFPFRLLHFLRF